MPSIKVALSDSFLDQFNCQDSVTQKRAAAFIRAKKHGNKLIGKDKASGFEPDGKTVKCQEYVDLKLRHYHINQKTMDPILVYQDLLSTPDNALWLLCFASHKEMFGNTKEFLTKYDEDIVK